MSPITHLLSGWVVASLAGTDRRDRALITWASVIPDLDGFGLPIEVFTRNSSRPITWWSDYHHLLGHNLGFALLCAGIAAFLSQRKAITVALVLLTFHLHLLEDLMGARGPDGHQWPIPYLLPFSTGWQWVWAGQWALNAWPNIALTIILLGLTLWFARNKGFSAVELFSSRADRKLVEALRRRFPVTVKEPRSSD